MKWDGQVFGKPAGTSGSVTMLGFPRKYRDSETQLAQNLARQLRFDHGPLIEGDGAPKTHSLTSSSLWQSFALSTKYDILAIFSS